MQTPVLYNAFHVKNFCRERVFTLINLSLYMFIPKGITYLMACNYYEDDKQALFEIRNNSFKNNTVDIFIDICILNISLLVVNFDWIISPLRFD